MGNGYWVMGIGYWVLGIGLQYIWHWALGIVVEVAAGAVIAASVVVGVAVAAFAVGVLVVVIVVSSLIPPLTSSLVLHYTFTHIHLH